MSSLLQKASAIVAGLVIAAPVQAGFRVKRQGPVKTQQPQPHAGLSKGIGAENRTPNSRLRGPSKFPNQKAPSAPLNSHVKIMVEVKIVNLDKFMFNESDARDVQLKALGFNSASKADLYLAASAARDWVRTYTPGLLPEVERTYQVPLEGTYASIPSTIANAQFGQYSPEVQARAVSILGMLALKMMEEIEGGIVKGPGLMAEAQKMQQQWDLAISRNMPNVDWMKVMNFQEVIEDPSGSSWRSGYSTSLAEFEQRVHLEAARLFHNADGATRAWRKDGTLAKQIWAIAEGITNPMLILEGSASAL